jgi:hypothetical protein
LRSVSSQRKASLDDGTSERAANLERLLARRPEGIFVNLFERGEIGPARNMGLPVCLPLGTKARLIQVESQSRLRVLLAHDLFRKAQLFRIIEW